MTDEELARIKRETIGATDTEYLAPSDVWGLILRLEANEAVAEAAKPVAENAFDYSTEDMRTLQEALEAWHSARGET